jgi:hypothetical protein
MKGVGRQEENFDLLHRRLFSFFVISTNSNFGIALAGPDPV